MRFLSIILIMFTMSCSKTKDALNETIDAAQKTVETVSDKGSEVVDNVKENMNKVAGPIKPITLSSASKIEFKVLKFAKLAQISGKFTKFQGEAKYDGKNISGIQAAIYTNSINTDDEKRDGHLRSKDWFAVAQYPIIEFTSPDAVELKSNFTLKGNIKIKGIKKSIDLEAKTITQNDEKIVIEATTVINRTDFGLTWNKPLEEEVTLMGKIGKFAVDEEVTLTLTLVGEVITK